MPQKGSNLKGTETFRVKFANNRENVTNTVSSHSTGYPRHVPVCRNECYATFQSLHQS